MPIIQFFKDFCRIVFQYMDVMSHAERDRLENKMPHIVLSNLNSFRHDLVQYYSKYGFLSEVLQPKKERTPP